MSITFIESGRVDREKWQHCVENGTNVPIYMNDWYLDAVCCEWGALVQDNYKSVLPLPIKKKFGFKVINHPLFAQRFTIATTEKEPDFEEWMKAIPGKFIGVRLRLQQTGHYVGNVEERRNLLLALTDYAKIESGYNKNTKRNLKTSSKSQLLLDRDMSTADFIRAKKENTVVQFKKDEWDRMESVIEAMRSNECGSVYGVYFGNDLTAAAVIARWKNRVYFLMALTSDLGRETAATFYLIDQVIREYSSQSLWLDFEGSMVENVARFYRGFGARDEIYHEHTLGIFKFV